MAIINHAGVKGMKWRNKKRSPDSDFHNSAAQRRMAQQRALTAKSSPSNSKGPDVDFHNDSAKRRAKQVSAKQALHAKRMRRMSSKIAKIKKLGITKAVKARRAKAAAEMRERVVGERRRLKTVE